MSSIDDIFGEPIKAPGPAGINTGTVPETITRLVSVGLNFIFAIAGIILAVQLIWGGLDWITSGGDSEKISAAQGKILNAIIGILIMVAALTIWAFIASNVLGTIKFENGGFQFKIPSINSGSSSNPGGGNDPGGSIQPVDPIFPTGSGQGARPTTAFQ